ncbi:hypothetical protein [Halomarina oriensis]|uniref:Uncharacterized protein n=1 Tax=Halomarina oriensis TaxID=671145 RepID=A0A6B0GUV2_9EURY|nr:hypothetical protein [Halomarina oriensis]MWG35498.1 hypothetical protein [Halomarina oriensis]
MTVPRRVLVDRGDADSRIGTNHLLAAVDESHSSIGAWEDGQRDRNRDLFTLG